MPQFRIKDSLWQRPLGGRRSHCDCFTVLILCPLFLCLRQENLTWYHIRDWFTTCEEGKSQNGSPTGWIAFGRSKHHIGHLSKRDGEIRGQNRDTNLFFLLFSIYSVSTYATDSVPTPMLWVLWMMSTYWFTEQAMRKIARHQRLFIRNLKDGLVDTGLQCKRATKCVNKIPPLSIFPERFHLSIPAL